MQGEDRQERQEEIGRGGGQAREALQPGADQQHQPGGDADQAQLQPDAQHGIVRREDLEALVVRDPGDRPPAGQVVPHRAIAIAGQRALLDLAADGVPDQGPPGEGRVAADELEDQFGGQGVDRPTQRQGADRREDRPDPQHRAYPAQGDQRHKGHAREARDQSGLGGRQHDQQQRSAGKAQPQPAALGVGQGAGQEGRRGQRHGVAQLVLEPVDPAPGAGKVDRHHAIGGHEDPEDERQAHHDGVGAGQHLQRLGPLETLGQQHAGQGGEDDGH